jgi:hypothetical protein
MQNLTDAVYNQAADRQGLLSYLTNHFDHYVNSNKSAKELHELLYDTNEPTIQRDTIHFRKRKNVYDADNDMAQDGNNSENEEDVDQYIQEVTDSSGFAKVKDFFKNICITKGKRRGNYLTVLFIFTRISYTINSFLQLFILNHFLGNNYLFLGFDVMSKVWNGEDWAQLDRFPRVTMCDFRIREVGIVHRYTVKFILLLLIFKWD